MPTPAPRSRRSIIPSSICRPAPGLPARWSIRIPARPRALALLTGALLVTGALGAACGSDGNGSDGGKGGQVEASTILGPDKAATGTPVKIGWVSTGQTQAIDTTGEIKAAQAVVAYANAKLGGLGGHPIELITCEDKSTPANAQDCGNRFVSEHVAAVAAGSPGQTDPWIKIINPAGIPAVINLTSTPVVLSTPNVFVWSNPLAAFGTPAAYARANKLTSAAVIVIDVPAASGAARTLSPAFFSNVGAKATVYAVAPGTPDMTPQIQAAEKTKPAMYQIVGDPTFCSSAIKAIKTLGIKAPITAIDRCVGKDQGASIPGGFAGVKMIAQANVDPAQPEFKLFAAVMKDYGKGLPTDGNSVSGYQGMLGLVRAFDSGTSTDVSPAGITKAIKSMPATVYPLGGGAKYQCNGAAIPAVSKNICATTGLVADSSSKGVLSNFRTLDATGIYKLGAR